MNLNAVRALFWDAVHQILDNWVFRILAVLVGVLAGMTFLVGFREEEIVLAFGLRRWDYDSLMDFLRGASGGSVKLEDPQGVAIEALLTVVFDYLAGNLGVLFCIIATAFFVPRMIEKGAADMLFHKPLGRFALYFSRYCAGLLFVAVLSTVLVTGMYLGLLLVSGHNDPGILLAAPLLTYLFGLVHGVSMLVGVVTRNTVAALLITILFFFFNGCIHGLWVQFERSATAKAAAEVQAEAGAGEEGIELEDEEKKGGSTIGRVFRAALDGLHYTLPKTHDADAMTKKLRKALNAPVYRDGDSRVAVFELPDGVEVADAEEQAEGVDASLAELLGEPRFGMIAEDGVSYLLWRRRAEETQVTVRGRERTRRENHIHAAGDLEDALEELQGRGEPARDSRSFGGSSRGNPTIATVLSWNVTGPPARERTAFVFRGTEGDWIYTLWIDGPAGSGVADPEGGAQGRASRAIGLESTADESWYEKELGFSAPWRFNLFFSIGSSVAFTLLVLLLGWWRLSRMEL